MPTSIFWRYLLAHLILNLIYLAYYTLLGRGRVLWQAKWDAIKELSKVLNKRQKIQNSIKVKSSDLTRAMERGWLTPYLLRYNLQKAKRKVSL